MNSNDNKNDDEDKKDDNVVSFKVPHPKQPINHNDLPPTSEPLFNMPPYTKYLLGILIGIHFIMTFLLTNGQAQWVFINLGFIPGRFTGTALFEPLALVTPFTNMFLHGGWLHLGMNSIMLLAFGSGIERWMGGKKMVAFFIACGLIGVALHFILNLHAITPVIGASGGISGLFAAALVMLNQTRGGMTGRFGLWPIIIIWVVISVVFGFIDTPQAGISAGEIAWGAHVGGFLGGFAVLKFMRLL